MATQNIFGVRMTFTLSQYIFFDIRNFWHVPCDKYNFHLMRNGLSAPLRFINQGNRTRANKTSCVDKPRINLHFMHFLSSQVEMHQKETIDLAREMVRALKGKVDVPEYLLCVVVRY